MAGFDNDVVYANNADFSTLGAGGGSASNGLLLDGQMWIGRTAVNAGGTHISVGTLTSPDSTVDIGFSTNNITLQTNAGNLDIVTANSTPQFAAVGSTLKLDFGLSNLLLGGDGANITSASTNVGIGFGCLDALTTGAGNTCVGWSSGAAITTGQNNSFYGLAAGGNVTTATNNTAIGNGALQLYNPAGTAGLNDALGYLSLRQLVSGTSNIALGNGSGQNYTTTESGNILIGNNGTLGESNVLRIGTSQTTAFVVGITGVTVAGSAPIAINSSSQLSSLGFGSSGQLLTSGGAGVSPSWTTVATGVSSVSGTANRITSTGGSTPVIDISASYVGQSSITTLGTIATGVWQGTSIALANGGTAASLTASNGGIFYSTASAGAILAGTATAGQMLQSGASTTPSWSTSTYPATNAVSTLLYASSANVMAALATANNGILITSAGGVPSWLANGTTGQILTATTGSPPSWSSAPAAVFSSIGFQTFTADGTYTPTAGMLYCIVECIGGGGGGGGAAGGVTAGAAGGGGGGAGYAKSVFSAATIGASQTITIGVGGTAGANTGTNGTNGTATTFGALLTGSAGGLGTGGASAASGTSAAGTAGSASVAAGTSGGGGGAGGVGWWSVASSFSVGGKGGHSPLGGPAAERIFVASGVGAGGAGTLYGAGGGGGATLLNANGAAGGAGKNGIVIVTEFI